MKAFAGHDGAVALLHRRAGGLTASRRSSDLKGKRIGVISLASASYADSEGQPEDRRPEARADVSVLPVGAGARAAAALKADQVDAIDSYSDSFTVMKQNGVELHAAAAPGAAEQAVQRDHGHQHRGC